MVNSLKNISDRSFWSSLINAFLKERKRRKKGRKKEKKRRKLTGRKKITGTSIPGQSGAGSNSNKLVTQDSTEF